MKKQKIATGGDKEDARLNGVQSVIIALRILECLASTQEDKGVTELAHMLGTTKARIHRHLQTLRDRQYVIQNDETEKYQPGIGLFLLGQRVRDRFGLFSAAQAEMEKLRDQLGVTVVLSILVDGEIQIVDLVRGTAPVEIVLNLNSRFPRHATAQGKIFLAYASAGLPSNLSLPKLAERTIVNRKTLEAEVGRVQARGWATAPNELADGVNAVAAPVFSRDGRIVASVAIVGSTNYVPAKPAREQIDAVIATARRISETVGWQSAIPR